MAELISGNKKWSCYISGGGCDFDGKSLAASIVNIKFSVMGQIKVRLCVPAPILPQPVQGLE